MDTDPDRWLQDSINENFVQLHRLEEVLYNGQTKFQSARIVRSSNFGVCLVLDGKIQSSEADEFIYHEALVQPAMITHPGPETVFIAGGGEGATLREILSHNTVKRAVMVDIDSEVIDICRRFLPSFHQGSFEDSRLELHCVDAKEQLQRSQEKFDVIILDLPEPIEEGPAAQLFAREFYEFLREKLTPQGTICLQAGCSIWGNHLLFTAVINTLKSVFPSVFPYQTHVPSYGGMWGFALASQQPNLPVLSPAEIDRMIPSRMRTSPRFYDGIAHHGMFLLPKQLRQAIDEEKRIITEDNPLCIYEP